MSKNLKIAMAIARENCGSDECPGDDEGCVLCRLTARNVAKVLDERDASHARIVAVARAAWRHRKLVARAWEDDADTADEERRDNAEADLDAAVAALTKEDAKLLRAAS